MGALMHNSSTESGMAEAAGAVVETSIRYFLHSDIVMLS